MRTRTAEELMGHILEHSFVDEETGCYVWSGCVAGKGYGVTCFESRQVYVHRFTYQFYNPDEVIDVVRHTCDNPACANIDHLRNGTTQDNVDDKVSKGRHIFGSRNYNAALTEDQIREIRSSDLINARLAEKYNVNTATIHYIRVNKTWRHVA